MVSEDDTNAINIMVLSGLPDSLMQLLIMDMIIAKTVELYNKDHKDLQ